MKKILVIDESSLFRRYLKQKLEELNFEVLLSINGLDGGLKIRSALLDLVIMDYYLSRKSGLAVLKEKAGNPDTAGIPVILVSTEIDKNKLLEIAKYNVKRLFTKPVKIDALLNTVSELLGVKLDLDSTPCIIEAHFNDEILFIELAQGLNREKIELLKFKIIELLGLYQKQAPKVLIIISDFKMERQDNEKLSAFLDNILETTHSPRKAVKVLTSSAFVKGFLSEREEFSKIEVADNLNQAMDGLLGIKVSDFIEKGHQIVREDFLSSTSPRSEKEELIHLRFDAEAVKTAARDISIAAVDDDPVIQELVKTTFSDTGWRVSCFENGKKFVQALSGSSYDLLFLDLMMPEMDGFEVLQYLKTNDIKLPVIVLSALSQKETVVKVLNFGVKSYLIKPLKPEGILTKTTEVLRMNF
ncbi:Regulator of RpoS [subsurface metagenome]